MVLSMLFSQPEKGNMALQPLCKILILKLKYSDLRDITECFYESGIVVELKLIMILIIGATCFLRL